MRDAPSNPPPPERGAFGLRGPDALVDALLAVLAHPALYVLSQRLSGGAEMRRRCIEALGPRPGQHLLDVGCGPAYYLPWIDPAVVYYGFDTEARYVAWAREHFGHRGTFFAEAFADRHLPVLPRFDGVLLLGLLHHLDDPDADALLDLVARALAPNGRVVTLDTCSDPRHSPLARWISQHDRGRHVRTGKAFVTLAERRFGRVQAELAGEDLPLGVGLWRMLLADPRPPMAPPGSP